MALRINSASISPNPVDASNQFILAIEAEEYTLPYVGLFDDSYDALFDSGSNRIYVANVDPVILEYTSVYSSTQIDAFINSVLGV